MARHHTKEAFHHGSLDRTEISTEPEGLAMLDHAAPNEVKPAVRRWPGTERSSGQSKLSAREVELVGSTQPKPLIHAVSEPSRFTGTCSVATSRAPFSSMNDLVGLGEGAGRWRGLGRSAAAPSRQPQVLSHSRLGSAPARGASRVLATFRCESGRAQTVFARVAPSESGWNAQLFVDECSRDARW